MDVADFDYNLPAELIAQHPLPRRSASRMLVLDRAAGTWQDRRFADLTEYLRPGDCAVFNDTRVLPARLLTRRPSGGPVELLLLRPLAGDCWEALARPARRLRPGDTLDFGGKLAATVERRAGEGLVEVRLAAQGDLFAVLEEVGLMPLPPYLSRPAQRRDSAEEAEDRARYQTVYARVPGAVAAPTAGLHFDEPALAALRARGVEIGWVTLHVGLGTFRPVSANRVEEHRMHTEHYEVAPAAVELIRRARASGGRCLAVGTTVVRTLETAAAGGTLEPGAGWSELFIYPGFSFRVVDLLLTNFHLPRSTLLMLVCALAGRELVLAAYADAMREGYRFYSYGDCMLIL